MKLSDFKDLSDVELGLVKWLQDGNRKTYVVSDSVPDTATEANTIRATLIRYLALGGCDACKPPETGVGIRGAWIRGDDFHASDTRGLDFNAVTLPANLALRDCILPDILLLRGARIRSIDLCRSRLCLGIGGDDLQAEGSLILNGANVTGAIRLVGAHFGGNIECIEAKLKAFNLVNSDEIGPALQCESMNLNGSMLLRHAKVTGEIVLVGARLGGNLECSGAELRSHTDKIKAETRSALILERMEAEGHLYLTDTNVTGTITMFGARLAGNLLCIGSTLTAREQALGCDGAEIKGALFLRSGTLIKGQLGLTNARFGAINDEPSCWPDSIRMDGCQYGAFLGNAPTDAKSRLAWLMLIPCKQGEFWPAPYEQCAKVLREMGHNSDARAILIEKERLQRKALRERLKREYLFEDYYWSSFWDRILGATVAYGRKPLLAAAWLLVPYILGVWIFGTAFANDQVKPNLPQIQRSAEWVLCGVDNDKRIKLIGAEKEFSGLRKKGQGRLECFHNTAEGRGYPQFNPYIYSADSLLPIVSMEMQNYWIPDDSQPWGKFARFYLWLHIIAGWALTLLAVAGFSGLIKTDSK